MSIHLKTYLWYHVYCIKFLNRKEVLFSFIAWTFFAQLDQNYREISFVFHVFFP